MRATTLIVSVVVMVAMAGCSLFMRSVERPTANVRDVSLASAGITGARGEVSLDVTNPNGFGVPLSGVDWELAIGGARAVTGSAQLSQTIPARAVAPVTTALSIGAADAVATAAALAGGARDYHLIATLRFSTAVGPLEVTVEHRGTLAGGAGGLGGLLGMR